VSEQLKPCSCGSIPRLSNHEGSAIHISCSCGIQLWGARAHFSSEEAATKEWNTRAQPNTCTKDGGPAPAPEPVWLWIAPDGHFGWTDRWDVAKHLPFELTKLYRNPPAQAPVVQKYDDTLLPFFELMRKELHANAGKGDRPGWLQMSADTCLLEIIYHFGKLQKAVKKGDCDGMNEYAADVANMCMMLLDICGALNLVEVVPVGASIDEIKRLNPTL